MSVVRESRQGGWESRWTFIAAATGAAVGLGNLWKFAYLAGDNGGAAFVLVYLICVFVLALPILIAEVMMGGRGRANPVTTMHDMALETGVSQLWQSIAWMGGVASLLILSYYSVIAGWALAYVDAMLGGQFTHLNVRTVAEHFRALLADPVALIMWQTLFLTIISSIVAIGIPRGVARMARLLIPVLLISLVLLVVYSSKVGDVETALVFLFDPNWQMLTPEVVLVAMGQAFFTLSIGVGAMMAYGAYMPDKRSVIGMLSGVVIFDTVIALLAGIAIFPLVFSLNIEPSMGPGLMFVALPYAFGQMVYGDVFGVLFFVTVSCVGVTSGVALMEPITVWLVERFRFWRPVAAALLGGLVWLLGLLTVFSMNDWAEYRWWGMNAFEFMNFASANILLPLGGWLIAVFVGWWMRREVVRDELHQEPLWFFSLWYGLLRYIAAPAVLIIFTVPLYQRIMA